MSEQRIDKAADAATSSDADPGDGQGLATPAAHPGGITGGSGDLLNPHDERRPADESAEGDTEGERSIQAAELNRPE
jgi:hypothetical protein